MAGTPLTMWKKKRKILFILTAQGAGWSLDHLDPMIA
jgi:hypothetical protein